ncbi:hypothetical protein CPT03_02285 [Pedobacter ginsengisoli]|uniref:Glycosyltransferase n=1 Tax=Pedobacter ginsengisoli TaxID=363852 RepID=A0A2D1U1I7_9SPHI|nr:hypothetical protein [Pedobacter ginsengisoli]ATP55374.1 hypothetical protein CPT03_02285 [Pedobacter ginsengisoli]
MIKELTILIVWHKESNPEKIKCFEENKRTFEQYNPGVEILVIINQFEDSNEAWLSSDLSIFNWYNDKTKSVESKRFLLIEWDCWCDISVEEYFSNTWNMDVVAPSVKYPERDSWYWFSTKQKLPDRARLYATGIVPFCGILVSEKAMKAIGEEIIKPDYRGLNSELRFASVATFLGYDPVPNPVCSRSVIWNPIIPFDFRFKGFHHPRKVLTSSCVLGQINTILDLDKCIIPRIIHQTYKDNSPQHI